jgi:hypothetical protein
MQLTNQLLVVARGYCAARSLSLARVSTLVFNEGKKLQAIANGRVDLSTGRFEKAMAWFSQNWPEAAAWPSGISRPSAASSPSRVDSPSHAGGPSLDPIPEISQSPAPVRGVDDRPVTPSPVGG